MTAERPVLCNLTYLQLAELLADWGEPRFRAEQVWGWLYRSLVTSYGEMANLPLSLRTRLSRETDLGLLAPLAEQVSASGQTRKLLHRLSDGQTIESVLMHYDGRRTACISSQAGCGMGCVFCATGQGGLARNLTAGEIVAQVLHFARELRGAGLEAEAMTADVQPIPIHPVDHVVLMGMGEPLANLSAVWQAIETLTDSRGYGLGARRITVSTVGLAPGIRQLAQAGLPINLAVSLHAANDALRDQLVPVNQRYPLTELMASVREYVDRTRRRVTFEYALIDQVNDDPTQAVELAELLRGLLCHVNLIPLNPTPGSPLQPSAPSRVERFQARLSATGIATTVRLRRGIDIEAGCGQLHQRQSGSGIAREQILALSAENGYDTG